MKFGSIAAALLPVTLLAASLGCSPNDFNALAADETPADANVSSNPQGAGVVSDATPEAMDVSGSDLPPELTGLLPPPGSQACKRTPVGVSLSLNDSMRKDGSLDPSTLALSLDGRDVTAASAIMQTANYPASLASIQYDPPADLALGSHRAAVGYMSSSGPAAFEWDFVVAAVPCQ